MDTLDKQIDEILQEIFNQVGVNSDDEELKKEAKSKLTKLIQEARIEQSTLTSNWIEKHIARLAKDPSFKNETAGVAFTYAQDQARQGRTKALKQE